ncbi:MAG: chromosome segregation protein SMC, partial [Myxococcales bacterium]|nr:chromosome segregation protein SMC [Myxococcales bacterium]
AVTQAAARLSDARSRIARAEAVLVGFERRKESERVRLDKLRASLEALGSRRIELAQEHDVWLARLEGLRGGKAQTASRKEELEAELRRLREAIHASDQHVAGLREHATERRSRLRSLEEIAQRFEGVGAGVRAVMTRFGASDAERRERGVLGLVADLLECPEELTPALVGALGERLQHIVMRDLPSGRTVLDFLRDGDLGRATLLPLAPARVVGLRPEPPAGEGVRGRLADLVRYRAEHDALVRHLLGDVFVVEDLEMALGCVRAGYRGASLVTLRGEVVQSDGALTGGKHDDAAAHLLEVHREIRELGVVVAELDAELGEAVGVHGELRRELALRQAEMDAARNEAHGVEIAIVEVEKDLRSSERERERLERDVQRMQSEIAVLNEALRLADQEESEARHEIDGARTSEEEADQVLASARGVLASRREAAEEQSQRVTELRVRAAQARQRAESDRGALERLGRSIEELDAREERLRGDLLAGARQQGVLIGKIVVEREELLSKVREAMDAREAVTSVREVYEQARFALTEGEAQLKQLRSRVEEASAEMSALSLRERELSLAIEHLLEQIHERHQLDLRRVIGDYHDRILPDAAVRGRIDELLRLIQRMGEINLMAIEEYEENSTRYETLRAQKEDLEEALIKLDRAIRQMNRESRRLFRDAFLAVNERFKLVFPQLFSGGKAELKLTEPDDLLESGIEIIAQPPGKRLGSLELMSGGEKALTAVALIFSIFQYKPSPFCLLDEVDAPLDEANVGRFAAAIRQMTDRSQFIVITHSKRTMEHADVLYGVTMEQPGVSKTVSVELRGEAKQASDDGSAAAAVA